ncbi:ribose-phosphate pyrophosphokinase [Ectothiorhodospiraceae bacterium 2226]|nr:ribose-phosphate pyrophosphokinase [Ectothiorhodospiraceae bacterium 2226]
MTLSVFALGTSHPFGERVAETLGSPLAPLEEREFEDGEHKARPLVSVRGHDVYVIHALHGEPAQSANDKLVRLLLFLGTLRDAGAARVTAVIPYLCYARKDRRTKSRDPVSTRYVAALLEAVGTDRVVTLDAHNLAAYQNAFRIPAEHLEARPVFAAHFARALAGAQLAVVSPDVGGIKRAEVFRETLEARLGRPVARAFMEKQRSAGVVSGDRLVGEVAGRTVVLVDDLISSGETLRRAGAACRAQGATRVLAAATHGVFSMRADAVLQGAELERVVVSDAVFPFHRLGEAARGRVEVLSVAPLVAEAIRRLHQDGSLVDLLEGWGD